MTWGELYNKMVADIQGVQSHNWEKLERALAHAIDTHDKASCQSPKSKKEVLHDNR